MSTPKLFPKADPLNYQYPTGEYGRGYDHCLAEVIGDLKKLGYDELALRYKTRTHLREQVKRP